MNTAAISLKNISKAFPGYGKVLSDVDLEIRDGEFFVFVGPSGSGKSTLLRIMSGLEKQYQGSVERSEGDIGFVFQQFALLPWLTVYQNVALGFVARNIAQRAYHANVLAELKSFNLEKAANLYPRELSGGMRQRVGLARAFAQKPKVVFMDEPFSELDTYTAGELKKDLLDVWHERKMTIVMVTHIVGDAIELADRIAVLTPRPGRIEKIVTNDLSRPRSARTSEFWKSEDELVRLIRP